jgi:carbonic anhydrase
MAALPTDWEIGAMSGPTGTFDLTCSCCGKPAHSVEGPAPSRRSFLAGGIAASVATMAAGTLLPGHASAQTTLSPDAALQALLDGNKRFVRNQLTSGSADLAGLRKKTVDKQEPFAAVLACADSRVPVELVFDQSIGQLFVARVAGNLATPENIASMEYGAEVLGVRTILVLGHSGCGAVTAALAGKEEPGQITGLFALIRPAVDQSGGDLETAIKDNAKFHAHILATASPLLAGLIKEGKLKIAAGYYALDTGQVTVLA